MFHRFGIGRRRPLFSHGRQQPTLYLTEISSVVGEPIPLGLEIRPWHDDMHVLGRRPLRFLQQLGIEAKLEHRPRLRFARELGVHHLVRPGSEAARALDPAQDIGTPNPAIMEQRALNDDLDSILHGRKRVGNCLIRYFSTFDADDVQTLTGQMRYIPFLVRQTPFP